MSKSVILIDDDDDDLVILSESIMQLGRDVSVVTYNDPTDAIARLTAGQVGIPDYIFLDINMPRMIGSECLEVIRHHRAFDESVVVMISTSMQQSESERLILHGADFAVAKPVKIEDYMKLLRKIVK